MKPLTDPIREQIAYYRARAGEYDDWFFRRGRYDRGAEFNTQWAAEIATVRDELLQLDPCDAAIELACGTGLWTQELVRLAGHVVAVDASPEMLEINRHRLNDSRVEYWQADMFAWVPEREFDLVFIAFWLSHVPPELLDDFLEKVRRSVRTGGRLFVMDSLFEPASTAKDHVLADKGQNGQLRKLSDGREFKVVKVFYEPAQLADKLRHFGFDAQMKTTGRFFLYGGGCGSLSITVVCA